MILHYWTANAQHIGTGTTPDSIEFLGAIALYVAMYVSLYLLVALADHLNYFNPRSTPNKD